VRYAISGGAGFLGLHLARHFVAQGYDVRTLDIAPIDDPVEGEVTEIRGDMRDAARVRELCEGADVVVHAAAALPIRGSRREIMSVNVDGTASLLAAAREAGVWRFVYISSTAVYGVPRVHPIGEDFPLEGVGAYGESKIACERLVGSSPLETVVIRPKTFLGPERLGVFEILFDWIRDGRRIYVLGSGDNRYQLLAVEDLVDAIDRACSADVAGETFNVGATEFGTVRSDLEALIAHAGTASRLRPIPARPGELALRALELARVSPLGEWHYKTASRDSFVDVSKAESLLGWHATKSNVDTLVENYDWYAVNRTRMQAAGVTHRVPWNQQALAWLKKVS
jgi:nucleoside-diphosphate-sugar epimerase